MTAEVVTGLIKSFAERFFEQVRSLSMVGVCCILVYMIAHASSLLPGWMSTYLEIPQVIIPWVNLLGMIGLSWIVADLLYSGWARVRAWCDTRQRIRAEAAEDAERSQMMETANRECTEIVGDSTHVLHQTLLLFMRGERIVELDAMMPEVAGLVKRNIIVAIDIGYFTRYNHHMCNYSLTPWVTEYVGERMLEAKEKLAREKAQEKF